MLDGFSPLEPLGIEPQDVKECSIFGPGDYLSSSVTKTYTDPITFVSTDSEGAVLILPDGSTSCDLLDLTAFIKYASANAAKWYKYAKEIFGYPASNGDLRLIVGHDKAIAWGLLSFSQLHELDAFRFRFRQISENQSGKAYRWEYLDERASGHSGPAIDEIEKLIGSGENNGSCGVFENQCLFARTLNITFHREVWDSLVAEGIGGRDSTDTLPSFEEHPSKIINNLLLEARPDAKIAMTQDWDWISVMQTADEVFPPPKKLFARILKIRDIHEDNGTVFLKEKPTDNTPIPDEMSTQDLSRIYAFSKDEAIEIRQTNLVGEEITQNSQSVVFTSHTEMISSCSKEEITALDEEGKDREEDVRSGTSVYLIPEGPTVAPSSPIPSSKPDGDDGSKPDEKRKDSLRENIEDSIKAMVDGIRAREVAELNNIVSLQDRLRLETEVNAQMANIKRCAQEIHDIEFALHRIFTSEQMSSKPMTNQEQSPNLTSFLPLHDNANVDSALSTDRPSTQHGPANSIHNLLPLPPPLAPTKPAEAERWMPTNSPSDNASSPKHLTQVRRHFSSASLRSSEARIGSSVTETLQEKGMLSAERDHPQHNPYKSMSPKSSFNHHSHGHEHELDEDFDQDHPYRERERGRERGRGIYAEPRPFSYPSRSSVVPYPPTPSSATSHPSPDYVPMSDISDTEQWGRFIENPRPILAQHSYRRDDRSDEYDKRMTDEPDTYSACHTSPAELGPRYTSTPNNNKPPSQWPPQEWVAGTGSRRWSDAYRPGAYIDEQSPLHRSYQRNYDYDEQGDPRTRVIEDESLKRMEIMEGEAKKDHKLEIERLKEVLKREEDMRRKEEEIRRKEEGIRRKEEGIRRKEEGIRRKEEESRMREMEEKMKELKAREEEARKKLEVKRKVEAARRQDLETNKEVQETIRDRDAFEKLTRRLSEAKDRPSTRYQPTYGWSSSSLKTASAGSSPSGTRRTGSMSPHTHSAGSSPLGTSFLSESKMEPQRPQRQSGYASPSVTPHQRTGSRSPRIYSVSSSPKTAYGPSEHDLAHLEEKLYTRRWTGSASPGKYSAQEHVSSPSSVPVRPSSIPNVAPSAMTSTGSLPYGRQRTGSMSPRTYPRSSPQATYTSEADRTRNLIDEKQEKFRSEQEKMEVDRRLRSARKTLTREEVQDVLMQHERLQARLPKLDDLTWNDFPWPLLRPPSNPDDISMAPVSAYFQSPWWPDKDKAKTPKDRIKEHLRRWHPDRFEVRILPRVVENEREKVKLGAGNVSLVLSDLLRKENEKS